MGRKPQVPGAEQRWLAILDAPRLGLGIAVLIGGAIGALTVYVSRLAAANPKSISLWWVWLCLGLAVIGLLITVTARPERFHNTIDAFRDFLSGASDDARYLAERSAEQRRRLAAQLEMEYKERLEQALGSFSGQLTAKLRMAPEAVPDPLDFLKSRRQTAPAFVPSNISISQLYQPKQSLLVLGEPGAGKTTLLLQLANQMLSGNDNVLEQVPVIAPLSTWERRKRRMRKGLPSDQLINWLADLFQEIYQIPAFWGASWLMEGHLILLLDGLDEIRNSSERSAFLVAANQYVSKWSSNVVLSCRTAEYEAVGLQAKLRQAVVIQPLVESDVLKFVRRQGPAYRGLAESLSHDAEMLKLCTSPLFLSMVMFTYAVQPQGQAASPPRSGTGLRPWLLSAYVDEQFKQAMSRGDAWMLPFVGPNIQRSRKWLSWLSENLSVHSQSEFLLERMRPNWLPKPGAFIVSLCNTLVIFLILFLYFFSGTLGLVFFFCYLGLSILFGFGSFPRSWYVRWSLKTALAKWRSQLAFSAYGLLLGLVVVVFEVSSRIADFRIWPFGFELNRYLTGLIIGAVFGEITGIIISGFTARVTESRRRPYDSVFSSLWTGSWVFALVCTGVVFGYFAIFKIAGSSQYLFSARHFYAFNLTDPAWNQAIHVGLTAALLFAYIFGWGFVLLHTILRFCIWIWGAGPGGYLQWLNAMVGLRFMYRSGAGFIFMHSMLQEAFRPQEFPRL